MHVRQRQRPLNPTLEATTRTELDKLLASHIIFPIKYSKWVANLVPVRKTMVKFACVCLF